MKRKYTIWILTAAALMTGCSDFLGVKPQGTLDSGALVQPDGAESLVIAAYAALQGPAGQENEVQLLPMTNWSYGEVRSDNAYKGGGGTGDAEDINKIETFAIDATNGNLDRKWYQLYCCVQRCNSALKALNGLTEEEMPLVRQRIAEMKVLRGHFYFELSRLFNRIPYFDENVEYEDYTDISNVEYTRDEILGMIAKDMQDAALVLPPSSDAVGHINRYVAYAYAAKVKLYQAYAQDENNQVTGEPDRDLLEEVVALCDEVIISGKYDLLDDFQQLDLVAYDNGKESVFAVQYSMNDGSPDAGRINWSNLLNAPKGPYGGDGFFLPSQNLVNAYKTGADGLPLFDTFNDTDYDRIEDGRYVQEDVSVDPRLDFIVGRPGITWKTYQGGACQSDWVRDEGAYGFHCCKRFFVSPESPDMYKGWPWGASSLNWQIIRYAHVLLWKAEALIELDRDLDEARELINKIRRRAKHSEYVRDFNDKDKPAADYLISEYPEEGWTRDYARKALRFETRLETAMEGERFFDLVRWGIAGDTMTSYIAKEKEKRSYYGTAVFNKAQHEYFPISLSQYQFSGGKYVQNPGYPELM